MNLLKNETLKFIYKENHQLTDREIIRYKKVAKYFDNKGRLLDVGCRHGEFRKYLRNDIEYFGVDFIEEYKKIFPIFLL